ncbi:hypothetical protein RB2150_00599 [Rhodobacterales bacterium HTCC2150]|nr:hypothetical protein RB2150_00599 [Rhodobacterales bacterium HTCC2150] [Rhodobacteraceae bacterium HTCC2150]
MLKNSNFSAAHMEIGTAAGGTLKELIGCYPLGRAPQFIVIDPLSYFPDQLNKIKKNLISAEIDPESVDFWEGTTTDFVNANKSKNLELDFLFIDADHRHHPVLVDLGWAAKVSKGGYICFHDDRPKFPGVGWAIRRFLKKNSNYNYVSKTDSLVIVQKKTAAPNVNISKFDIYEGAIRWSFGRLLESLAKKWRRIAK